MQTTEILFETLQVAVGNRTSMSRSLSDSEWIELADLCNKQGVMGIAFGAISLLPEAERPSKDLLVEWTLIADSIRERNNKRNEMCGAICRRFMKDGLQARILKGQSNGQYYPSHLKGYRSPGDVDVWISTEKGDVKSVIEYVLKYRPKKSFINYHHADFPVLKDTELEVHYRPTWMSAPWRERVLQKWYKKEAQRLALYDAKDKESDEKATASSQEGIKDNFPRTDAHFDAVYQLIHIYRHLFAEGIGLRQIIDYYFVLNALSAEERRDTVRTLQSLGMTRFTRSMMWVLQQVLLLPDELLLMPADEKGGAMLMEEIMIAGDLGHYDSRYNFDSRNHLIWGLKKLHKNLHFLTIYPEETLMEPVFRVIHFLWRAFSLWKY